MVWDSGEGCCILGMVGGDCFGTGCRAQGLESGEGCWMILGVGLFHLVIEVEGLIQEHGHYAFEGFLVPIWSKKVG